MNPLTRERASQLFAALGNTTRLQIVELLITGERTVNDVAATLNLQQSSASQHLAVLTRAGVLQVTPKGTTRIYRVRGPRIVYIVALIEEFCNVHALYGMETDPMMPQETADPAFIFYDEGQTTGLSRDYFMQFIKIKFIK